MCLCIYIYIHIYMCGFQKCIKLTAWCIVANAPCFIHMNKYDCVRLSCFCALFHVSRTFAQCFLGIKCTPNHHIGSPNTSTHVGCKSVRLSANFATFCTIEAWFPSWEFKLREQGNNNPHFIPKSRSPTIHPKKNRKTIFTKIFSKKNNF